MCPAAPIRSTKMTGRQTSNDLTAPQAHGGSIGLPAEILRQAHEAREQRAWQRMAKLCSRQTFGPGANVSLLISMSTARQGMAQFARSREALLRAAKVVIAHPEATQHAVYSLAVQLNLAGANAAARRVLAKLRERGEAAEILARRLQAATPPVNSDIAVVAIGQNCMTDTLCPRWGMGAQIVRGPFTAGAFPLNSAAKALLDDFRAFADPAAYRVTKTPSGLEAPTVKAYGAYLNHQIGPYWMGNGMARVISLYEKRIALFLRTLAERRCLLVFTQTSSADVPLMVRAVERLAPRFRILVIDYRREADAQASDDARVSYLRAAMPNPDYVWNLATHFDTPDGFAFEAAIAQSISSLLRGSWIDTTATTPGDHGGIAFGAR